MGASQSSIEPADKPEPEVDEHPDESDPELEVDVADSQPAEPARDEAGGEFEDVDWRQIHLDAMRADCSDAMRALHCHFKAEGYDVLGGEFRDGQCYMEINGKEADRRVRLECVPEPAAHRNSLVPYFVELFFVRPHVAGAIEHEIFGEFGRRVESAETVSQIGTELKRLCAAGGQRAESASPPPPYSPE